MQSYPDLDTFRLTNAKLPGFPGIRSPHRKVPGLVRTTGLTNAKSPGFIGSGYLTGDSVTLLYLSSIMLTIVLQCSIVSCYRWSGSVRVQRYRDAGESLGTGVRGPRSHGDRETGWRVAGGGDFCELGKWVLSQNQITKYS
jgi:hypothetical protein